MPAKKESKTAIPWLQEIWAKYKKEIIALIVVVILLLLWNKHGYKLMRYFKPDVDNNSPEALTDVRKVLIEEHMKRIKTDIDDISYGEWYGSGHDYGLYHTLLGWYDNEIGYAADYYKNFLASGKSLHADLKGESFFWGDVNTKVLDKLTELGKT